MNLSKINLNLLVALDALLTERNVTRAGNKLFITQSAMSNILKQLRELFQDDLLLQTGRTMTITRRGLELQPKIKEFLIQAEVIFNPKKFVPANSKRLFTLGMEEYAAVVLLPLLYRYLSKHAPGIQLNVKHVPLFHEKAMLDSQEIELFVGLLHKVNEMKGMSHDVLFRERFVCIGNAKNSLLKSKLTLKKYLSAKHLAFHPEEDTTITNVDHVLANLGYQRSIAMRLSRIVPGLYTISQSDIIATVPEGIAKEAKRLFNLVIQDCPVAIPEAAFVQLWHPWTHLDSSCQWLRNVILQLNG